MILASGYDGACTQFASDGITEGARTSAWPEYRQWAHENGLLFITAVAPGFDDSKTNPGNRLSKFAVRTARHAASPPPDPAPALPPPPASPARRRGGARRPPRAPLRSARAPTAVL